MSYVSDPKYNISPVPHSRPGIVLTKPFEVRHLNTKVKSGFATVEQKSELVELEMVMNGTIGNAMLSKGHKILVRADYYAQSWARQVIDYNGTQCIIVPQDAIIGWIA